MRIDIMDNGMIYMYKNVTSVSIMNDSNEIVITYTNDDGKECNKVIRRIPEFTVINEEHEIERSPKFRDQQEKHRVFHTITAIEKFLTVTGNNDAIDDISILKELVRKTEVEE